MQKWFLVLIIFYPFKQRNSFQPKGKKQCMPCLNHWLLPISITSFFCFQGSPLMQKAWACHYLTTKLKGPSGKSMAQSGDMFNSDWPKQLEHLEQAAGQPKCSWVAGPAHMKAALATKQQLHLYFLLMAPARVRREDCRACKEPPCFSWPREDVAGCDWRMKPWAAGCDQGAASLS